MAWAALLATTPAAAAARTCADRQQARAPSTLVVRDAPVFDVGEGPGFLLVRGAAALADAACLARGTVSPELTSLVERVDRDAGIDPALVALFTTRALACGDLFYLPIANDARGIGYRHEDAREVFDDSPDSHLEGIAFLNDFPYWRRRPDELERAFAHEIGHRWSARVQVADPSGDSSALLGRERKHWSYFLATGGSPLEGNTWSDAGGGVLAADTPTWPSRFSDFDLYLMGAMPADEVQSEALVTPDAAAPLATDCRGHDLDQASPPQTCGALSLAATRRTVTIDDVIAVEGPREPEPDATPRSVDVAFIVLADDGMTEDDCTAFSAALGTVVRAFGEAARGRVLLANATQADGTCDAIAGAAGAGGAGDATRAAADGRAGSRTSASRGAADGAAAAACSLGCATRRGGGWSALLALGVGVIGALRRRRHAPKRYTQARSGRRPPRDAGCYAAAMTKARAKPHSDPPYELVYWPGLPGRGEFVRLAFEHAGVPYTDWARVEGEAGGGVSAVTKALEPSKTRLTPFAVPALRHGERLIAHTAAILQYLGPRLGLVPDDEDSQLRAQQLQLTVTDFTAEVHDVHHPIAASLYYKDQKEEALRRAPLFVNERIPEFLEYFDHALDSNPAGGGVRLVGSDVSYPDLSVFHLLAGLRYAFPRAMARHEATFPRMTALHASIAEQPRIAAYLASERRVPFNRHGVFRHYPELDAEAE